MRLITLARQMGRAVGSGGDEFMAHHLADVVFAHPKADRLGTAMALNFDHDLEHRRSLARAIAARSRPAHSGRGAYRAIRIDAPPSR